MVNMKFNHLIDVMGMPSMYTINQGRESIFMKRVVLLLGMVFSMMSVYADENVLQTIEIEPVKDTYNIVLVSDKAVDVKKTVQASNKINIVLKDIRASKTLNTIYNNVSNVDTVMVEPQGNGVNIFFQADNAEKATISFDSTLTPAPAPVKAAESKNIKLGNPIESYAPIYNETYEQSKTSSLFKKLTSGNSVASVSDSLEESTTNDMPNKLISFGLVVLLVAAVARLFKRKEPEMKIGLAQQQFGSNDLGLLNGLQPQLQPAYQAPAKPFTTVNYGLNAYKNENRNPYESAPMQFHNPRLQSLANQAPREAAVQTIAKPAIQTAQAVAQQVKKMTTPVNTAPVNQSNPNVDNLKFLESMTAIYEKSGRPDLARGLKASLSKNNIK